MKWVWKGIAASGAVMWTGSFARTYGAATLGDLTYSLFCLILATLCLVWLAEGCE